MGYSAPLSALVAALTCLPVALLRATTRQGIGWRSVLGALEEGARNTLAVAMACACAGIVIGVVTITGLGITFTQVVIALAQNSLVLALVLTAMAGIVLGMGMPTTPAYIVMVSLLVPAIIKLGAVTPAAHMFAFYFAILSAITPPVALAVFAAAGLAKANMWATGWAAMRAGGAGLHRAVHVRLRAGAAADRRLDHQPALPAVSATLGVILLAAGLFGYLLRPATSWQRALLIVAALLLIKPGWMTDLAGIALAALVGGVQMAGNRRAAARPAA